MMMKCDGRLDEALQELFFHTFGFAPYVFPDFMGVIEFARVEQADSAVIAVGVHDFENTMGVEPVAAQKDIFDRVDLGSENGWWRSAGSFLSPLRGLFTCSLATTHGLRRGLQSFAALRLNGSELLPVGVVWSFVRIALGLGFVTPVLGLAIDDCVALAGGAFQLLAIDNGYGASGVFD